MISKSGSLTRISRMARGNPLVIGLRLYVDSDNDPAMRVSAALGMQRARYTLFEQEF